MHCNCEGVCIFGMMGLFGMLALVYGVWGGGWREFRGVKD